MSKSKNNETNNVSNVTNKKSETKKPRSNSKSESTKPSKSSPKNDSEEEVKLWPLTKETMKLAIVTCESDIQEISTLFGIGTRHTYRKIVEYELKEYYHGLKKDPDNLIGDLAKDILIKALEAMNPKDLSKQQVTLLIFTLKSRAGFIEAKSPNGEGNDPDNPDEKPLTQEQRLEELWKRRNHKPDIDTEISKHGN